MMKLFTTIFAVAGLLCCGCSKSDIAEDAAPIAYQTKMQASLYGGC